MSTTSRYITFRAVNPQKQQEVTLRPCEDQSGKVWTGQGESGYYEFLTQKDKESLPYIVTPETSVVISDGKTLDLQNPRDKANWPWIQKHPYVSMKRRASYPLGMCFFIDDPIADANFKVKSTEQIDIARYKVRQTSVDGQIQAAEMLGLMSAKSMQPGQVTDWLLNQANTAPGTVIEAVEPTNKKKVGCIIWLNKAIQWSVIERSADSIYRFGGERGTALGHDKDTAVEFLLSPENTEIVKIMKTRLNEITGELADASMTKAAATV